MTKFFLDTEFKEDGKTIDLISIAIVSDDGREYYAISKEFNLLKAWRDKWIRENVLRPIFDQFYANARSLPMAIPKFGFWSMRSVIKSVGQSREEIKLGVAKFVYGLNLGIEYYPELLARVGSLYQDLSDLDHPVPLPQFYAYYADYDWVVLCQLFGSMMDLPPRFPMYCIDLKQQADIMGVDLSKEVPQENEHISLDDARWVKKGYEYLREFPLYSGFL